MSLDMFGHIDSVFVSVPADRISKSGGSYVDGKWVPVVGVTTPHTVTIQPASDREIDALVSGGERIVDARRIYVNDGVLASISPSDQWVFESQTWKTVKLDNRPWRNYCKAIVSRVDNQ